MRRYVRGLNADGKLNKQLTRQLRKVSIKEIPKLTAKAQKIFNTWIRERDKGKQCISCSSFNITDASHYLNVGHYSALRFNEMNVNASCSKCNRFLHGNLIHYRQGLVKRYGEEKVLMLESSAIRSVKKWSRFELEAIIQEYKI
jgi:hypothetical protein